MHAVLGGVEPQQSLLTQEKAGAVVRPLQCGMQWGRASRPGPAAVWATERQVSGAPGSGSGRCKASAACGVGRSLQPAFLITLRCVSRGEQACCFLDFDGLHQDAFLPIG